MTGRVGGAPRRPGRVLAGVVCGLVLASGVPWPGPIGVAAAQPQTTGPSILAELPSRLPSPRWASEAAATDGAAVYLFGGYGGARFLDEILRFDPRTGLVETLAWRLPSPRAGAAAVWGGDAFYIMGGSNGGVYLDEIVRFDPRLGAMDVVARLPSPNYAPDAVWAGGAVYVFGGSRADAPEGPLDTIVRFDPATRVVEVLPARLPGSRSGPAAVWTGDVAYIFGGATYSAASTDIARFDPATGAVDIVGSLPRRGHHWTASWDPAEAVAYVFGGCCDGPYYDTIVRFLPGVGAAAVDARLPTPRHIQSSVALGEHTYLFGGADRAGELADVHRWGPASPLPGIPVLSEEFDTFQGWTYVPSVEAFTASERQNVNGAFGISAGHLVVQSFGEATGDSSPTGDGYNGPIAVRRLPLTIPPAQDFELSVALGSGSGGYGELRVSLIDDLDRHVGGVSWVSTCGGGTGAVDVWAEEAPLDGVYTGCTGENVEFDGLVTVRREGNRWRGLIDGADAFSATLAPSRTANAIAILMGNPYPPVAPRDMSLDRIDLRLLGPVGVMGARLPTPRFHTSAVWTGEAAYVFGGADACCWTDRDEIVRYDPSTDTAQTMAGRLPLPTRGTAAVWDGRYAYIFGGWPDLDTIVRYDPATDTVTTMGARLPRGTAHASAVWTGQYAYVFGAYCCDETIVRYDPSTDTVTSMTARMPGVGAVMAAVWTGQYAYILGGQSASTVDTILRYDPGTDTVATMGARLPIASSGVSAAWDGERVWLFGGVRCCWGELDQIVSYDPALDVVTRPNVALPAAVQGTSAVWAGGQALIFGGGANPLVDTVVRFAPAAPAPPAHAPNAPPVAVIAPLPVQQCIAGGTTARLDGSASSDPDGDTLTFAWSAAGIAFAAPTSPAPTASFKVGATPVSLTVSDGLLSSTATADVVVADTRPPAADFDLIGTLGRNAWWHSDVTATFSATDACGAAVVASSVDGAAFATGGAATVTGDGVHAVEFYAEDATGNRGPTERAEVPIDTLPPTTLADPTGTAGEAGWWRSEVLVAFQAVDATSGVADTRAALDGAPPVSTLAVTVAGDGAHEVQFQSEDNAGLVEAIRSVGLRVDATPPETRFHLSGALGGADWWRSPVLVELECRDATSGCSGTEYSVDGGVVAVYPGAFSVGGDGTHWVQVRSRDAAGNVQPWLTVDIRIDTKAPVTTPTLSGLLGDHDWWRSRVTVMLQCADDGSGCAQTFVAVDGGPFEAGTSAAVDGDGPHRVSFRSDDVAGNDEGPKTMPFQIDATPPTSHATLSGVRGRGGWWVSPVGVTLDSQDATSGVAGTMASIDQGFLLDGRELTVAGDGRHEVQYAAEDVAGNAEGLQGVTFQIDLTPPVTAATLTGTLGGNAWWRSCVAVALDAQDATSGPAATRLRVDEGPWLSVSSVSICGEGSHEVGFQSEDAAGNVEALRAVSLRIDSQTPRTEHAVLGSAGLEGWWLAEPVVTIRAEDAQSGVRTTMASIDGQSTVGPTVLSFVGEGRHELRYQSVDLAGNLEEMRGPFEIPVDTRAPTVALLRVADGGPDPFVTGVARLDVVASDSGSGLARADFYASPTVNGTPFAVDLVPEDGLGASFDTTAVADGALALAVRVFDRAGRWADEAAAVTVDNSPPDVRMDALPEYVGSASVPLVFGAEDSTNGIGEIIVEVRDETLGMPFAAVPGSPFPAGTGTATFPGGIDGHRFEFRARAVNGAGLASADAGPVPTTVDATAPVTRLATLPAAPDGANGWFASAVNVMLSCEDATSGCAGTEYRIGGGEFSDYAGPFSLPSDGVSGIEFRSMDVAGNEEASAAVELSQDTRDPGVEIVSPRPGSVSGGITGPNQFNVDGVSAGNQSPVVIVGTKVVHANASDETSGMARVSFAVDNQTRAADSETPYLFWWDAGKEAAGNHLLQACAEDRAGRRACQELAVITVPTTVEGAEATLDELH